MSIKNVRRYVLFSAVALSFLLAAATFADVLVGSGTASFQNWTAADLDQDGKPYWDNVSMDGDKQNVGYYMINAPTAPLPLAPGALPYWGNAYNPATDSGGSADPSFYFQNTASSLTANLELEVAGNADINQFGWYDITQPLVLHPIFLGPDSPPDTTTFSPSAHYGFYLTGSDGTFFTQSSLNPNGDTSHQHFVVFQQSSLSGAGSYWIGIEDLALRQLNGNEGCVGDYNDMLIRISDDFAVVPEPSTAALAAAGLLLMLGLLSRRRR
jgi:hypothetical protein